MNGTLCVKVAKSAAAVSPLTGRWIGSSENTNKARPISRRSHRVLGSDYERTMLLIADIVTKKGDRIGDRKIKAITPVSADKIYEIICRVRAGCDLAKAKSCRTLPARLARRASPAIQSEFDRAVPNPWDGVTKQRRTKGTKAAATREQVYAFAWGSIERGARSSGSGSHLFRVAPAAGERLGGLPAMDGLSQQGMAERDQDRTPQDRRGCLSSARGTNDGGIVQILRGCRGGPCASAAPWRADDPERIARTA